MFYTFLISLFGGADDSSFARKSLGIPLGDGGGSFGDVHWPGRFGSVFTFITYHEGKRWALSFFVERRCLAIFERFGILASAVDRQMIMLMSAVYNDFEKSQHCSCLR